MFGGCRVETVRALLAYDRALRLKRNSAGNHAIWWARFQLCGEVLRLIGEQAHPTWRRACCTAGFWTMLTVFERHCKGWP